MPSGSRSLTFRDRWNRLASTRQGILGAGFVLWSLAVIVGDTVDAWQALSAIYYAAAWGVALACGRALTSPWVTWPMAAVGLVLLWRIPAPRPLPEAPPRRPDEADAVLRRLSGRGIALAQELTTAYPYIGYQHEQALRRWAADIHAAARRYVPPSELHGLHELRTMQPHADNAVEFIQLYLHRIEELLPACRQATTAE